MGLLDGSVIERLTKAGEWPVLVAVRRGLAQVLPLIIVGAAALLILNLPVPGFRSMMDRLAGGRWRDFFQIIQQGSFGIASLAVLIAVSLAYAQQKVGAAVRFRVNPMVTTMVCLSSYFVVAAPLDGTISRGFFSLNGGLPIALCVAATCAPLFLFLTEYSPLNKYSSTMGSDPEITDVLVAIPSGAATILVFGCVRLFMEQLGWSNLHLRAQTLFGTPFEGAAGGLGMGVGYVALSQVLWFFGIHGPNMLVTVEQSILDVASQTNIQAAALGLEPRYILTKPFVDAFVHIGGSGSTLSLILAIFLKSKEVSTRRLALVGLLPALFNVNEIILFGLPLVLNPLYAVPFLLAPVVQTVIAYGAAMIDWAPKTQGDMHWTSPILLAGYAATGSARGALLQVICLAVGTLVYLPFVNLANSVYLRRFQKVIGSLGAAADSPATSPSGRKCVDLPGPAGQFARALAADLELALDRDDQIFLMYQPVVDVDLGRTVGAEALLRWRHPIHGPIPPHVTVALAEDTGLISRLGMRVLADACRQHAVLMEQAWGDPILSVNMSAPQFDDERLVEKVVGVLTETGVQPNQLKLEVTESIALKPEARTISLLRRLREIGVRVSIDDFGMGHTSLRYLKEFPVDTVKIDRSLTQESAGGVNESIITSIVGLCRALGVQIIVEGAETPEQFQRFRAHGCSLFQGYLFSRPLSGEAYLDFFRESGTRHIRDVLRQISGESESWPAGDTGLARETEAVPNPA